MSAMIAPADEAGIIAAVQAARAAREPLAIEGQGSKRGLLRPVQAARSLSTRGLTGVTLYRPAELIISARAGTPLAEIEAALAEKGQQLIAESPYLNGIFGTSAPPSIGGVVAANLSGPRRITWGATRDHVMGLRFINGAGEVIRSGGRVLKNVTGLDLCKLLSGSYGTLGVITEVTLKLYPLPEAVSAAICHFPSVQAAVATTIQAIQMGVPIARCELLDANAVRAVNAQSGLSMRESPLLLMEFHGTDAGVKEQAETMQDIANEQGGEGFEWASTPEERTRLWTARHKAYFAGMSSNPGCRTVTTDTCVPISRLAEIIDISVQEAAESGLPHYIVGHVGDGNFHLAYMVKEGDLAQRATAERLSLQMVQRAIALEGTCTGEHGIGLHKMGFLVDEAGVGAVDLMRQIKRALDPQNIMNPGKIFAL